MDSLINALLSQAGYQAVGRINRTSTTKSNFSLGADMMIDDDILYGTREELDEMDDADLNHQQLGEASHFFGTIRDFEQLLEEYGVQRVFSDMDQDVLDEIADYLDASQR